ncbi:Heterokaryon incompatibility protein 6, OR allele [Madurella mycetomatis]|uniref:Heterokaryon incompatibility protein 6, OR allele n=1 Tax=Madurella mycetomatis TaxID=100816 RepID=A0A175VV95_9PEZI|nr:Heterokaryon incompatibility protein 6, OR allele [Madurella mycetomatis]
MNPTNIDPAEREEHINSYSYSALGPFKTGFRLLELFPSSDRSAPLTCRLFLSSLPEVGPAPPYTALSYVWGDGTMTHRIFVRPAGTEGSGLPGSAEVTTLAITESMHTVLVHLRDTQEMVTLWADQLCINQEDDVEKSHQVQLMGRIYANAKQVVVWLGPAADESDAVMEAWREIGQAARDLGLEQYYTREKLPLLHKMMFDPEPDDPVTNRFSALVRQAVDVFLPLIRDNSIWKWFCRPWFERAWVIQEFCLCEYVLLACGEKRLDPALVMLAVQIMGVSASRHGSPEYRDGGVLLEQLDQLTSEPTTSLFGSRQRRQKFDRGEPHARGDQLHMLLKKLYVEHDTKTTQYRDRIYSLLGLAVDAEDLGITPDYIAAGNEGTARILTDAARKMITNPASGRIDILCCSQFPKLPGLADHLPSWVPDWRGNLQRSFYKVNEVTSPHIFAACGNTALQPVPSYDPRVLGLRGFVVDTIEAVSPDEPLALSGDFDADIILKYLAQINLFADIAMAKSTSAAAYPSRERMAEARWRVPIADLYWTRKTSTKRAPPETGVYHRQAVEALEFIRECAALSDEEQTRRFAEFRWREKYRNRELGGDYRESLKCAIGKRPFLTQNGYLGLAPPDARPGDVVVVFGGGRIPFVLRFEIGEEERFAFIGEAYCDGIMDGEVVGKRELRDLFLV